jgi:hypothetical protein
VSLVRVTKPASANAEISLVGMWRIGSLRRWLNPRCEDGVTLVLALGILVFFSATTVTAVVMTRSTQTTTTRSSAGQGSYSLAEAGLNSAQASLYYQNANGGNPSAANLLGCSGASGPSDVTGPSNCTSPSPKVICVTVASPCTAGTAGTVSLYGFFSGADPATYAGRTIAASTWLLISTGYAASGTDSSVVARSLYATVKISPLGAGAVASVWNHIFITSPLVAGQCQLDLSGNGATVNAPLYVIGNFCLGTSHIVENGLPVDIQIGGELYLTSGNVGASAAVPITSGVVVGGCTTVSISSTGYPCTNGSYHWWVGHPDTFVSQAAPAEKAADIVDDYNNFDPGPKHACAAGNNPYAPLASTVFDNNTTQNNSAGTFTLTPASSYTCNSQSGSSVGQLQWNNTTKVLTLNGSIFIDGNLLVNQGYTYTGTAVIEVAGTVTFSGNNQSFCAISGCTLSNWQGSSGNNQMLTFVALASNTTGAVTFADNAQVFQGSLWVQPSSSLNIVKNTTQIQGPLSIGSLSSGFNGASFQPLPVIKNMPAGAPIPPNTAATIETPVIVN